MTPDELAFVNRMVPHIERGLSFDDAAKAVLADDQRLWLLSIDRRGDRHDPERPGDVIVREIAGAVYAAVKTKESGK